MQPTEGSEDATAFLTAFSSCPIMFSSKAREFCTTKSKEEQTRKNIGATFFNNEKLLGKNECSKYPTSMIKKNKRVSNKKPPEKEIPRRILIK
jgi:hypothetical protein